jgi:beta-glucanase (GH16 family)
VLAVGAAALLLAGCTAAGSSSVSAPGTREPRGEVVFREEFDGAELDRTKWKVEVWEHTVNDENQAYIDAPDVLRIVRGAEAEGEDGGALAIVPRWRPGFVAGQRSFDFVSGRINTQGKMEFTYGTAAARIKLPPGAGLWPAFWALGGGDWPATGEIDIMEYVGEPDWASVALHGPGYSGDTPLFNRFYFPPGQDATGWHVYAVSWSRDSLVFRFDSAVVYRATRPMVEHYGRWAFDEPKFLILNFALGGAYPLKVNGVRQPYLGLPAETVEQIRAGRVRMLVDWVRVTRR